MPDPAGAGEGAEAQHAIRVVDGDLGGDGGAGRRAGHVEALHAEVVRELGHVAREPRYRELVGPGSGVAPWPRMSMRATRKSRASCGTHA